MNIPENLDRWMFDYLEGNLSTTETATFEQYLAQNPAIEADLEAWQNAAIPNQPILYPNQNSLIRKKKIVAWHGWSAAAIVLLLLGVGGYLLMTTNSDNNNLLAFKNKTGFENELIQTKSFDQSLDNSASNFDNNSNGVFNNTVNNNSVSNWQSQTNNQNQNSGLANNNNNNNTTVNSPLVNHNSFRNNSNLNRNEGTNIAANPNAYKANDLQNNSPYSNKKNKHKAIEQEQDKYKSNKYVAQYKHNPSQSNASLDLEKKNNFKYNSFSRKTKHLYRKIEKMFGYPIGLVNLRDPDLILPNNDLISFNPGFTGGMLKPRFEMKYRNQWYGKSMNSHQSHFSFDNYIQEVRGGFGVAVSSATFDNMSAGQYSVDLTYSPKIMIGKNLVFEPGIKVSLGVVTGNSSKMKEDNLELERGLVLNNSAIGNLNETKKLWYKDYGLGFVLNAKHFYAGFSADNLSNHYASVFREEGNFEPVKTPVLFNGIIGADYVSANKNMAISPFISFRKFGNTQEAWAGLSYRLNHFTIAGGYSTNKDYTAAIGMKFKKFKVVYQYDYTNTLLTNEQIGSHNIGIRFNGAVKNRFIK